MERMYEEKLRILNTDAGTVVADAVTVAEAPDERRKAWLGRNGAAPGEALWLKPCTAVHCCFIRFSVDVAFLDRNLRVVKTVRALRPWHVAGALRAHTRCWNYARARWSAPPRTRAIICWWSDV